MEVSGTPVFANRLPSVSSQTTETDRDVRSQDSTERGTRSPENSPSGEEKQQIRKLKARDREVKAHEAAHRAVGGQYVTGGSFQREKGPDGRLYVVSGDVRIDTSPIGGDPAATLEKAITIGRAALAPAKPSQQDRAVAARAAKMAADARAELARQRLQEQAGQAPAGAPARSGGSQSYATLASDEPQAIDLVV